MITRQVGRYANMKKKELIEALEERMVDMTIAEKSFHMPALKRTKSSLIRHLEHLDTIVPVSEIELLVNKVPARYQLDYRYKI
jgi:hypothetical protein